MLLRRREPQKKKEETVSRDVLDIWAERLVLPLSSLPGKPACRRLSLGRCPPWAAPQSGRRHSGVRGFETVEGYSLDGDNLESFLTLLKNPYVPERCGKQLSGL